MKKLDSLMHMLEKLVPADKIDVFCSEGTIIKNQPLGLPFRIAYLAEIYINDFSSNAPLLFAHIARWITLNEPKNTEKQFEFEVGIERETESFIAILIELTERINVVEDPEGGLVVDVC